MRQDVARVRSSGNVDGHVAFIDVLDDSILVDHKRGAISVAAIFVINSVIFHHCVLDVAQQRKRYSELFGEFSIRIGTVNAHSENLRVVSVEFGDISLIRLKLLRSTSREGEHVESKYDVLLALEIRKLYWFASCIG